MLNGTLNFLLLLVVLLDV